MIYGKCQAGLNRLMYTMESSRNIHMNERWPARWGITLIPPESLPAFQEVVIADRRMNRDGQLAALADKISEAIRREKYMIHFGV